MQGRITPGGVKTLERWAERRKKRKNDAIISRTH